MESIEAKIKQLVDAKNASTLINECENMEIIQDLEVAIGAIAAPDQMITTALLAAYIIQDELGAARHLVQRTPVGCRSQAFVGLAAVAIQLWKHDVEAIHVALTSLTASSIPEWSRSLVNWTALVVQSRIVNLVAKAYSSVSVTQFCLLLGLTQQQAVEAVSQLRWSIQDGLVIPVRPETRHKAVERPGLRNMMNLVDSAVDLEMF